MELKIITREEAVRLGLTSVNPSSMPRGGGGTKYIYGGMGPITSDVPGSDAPDDDVKDMAFPQEETKVNAPSVNPPTGKEKGLEFFRVDITSGKKEILKDGEYVPEELC
jgi:hypothetical protein